VTIDINYSYYAEVAVMICASGTVNLQGRTLTAWFYFAGPSMTFDYTNVAFWATGPSTTTPVGVRFVNGTSQALPTNKWVQYQGTFTTSVDANYIGISLGTGSNWSGTMYVDSVSLSP